jgi:hypothetical protein
MTASITCICGYSGPGVADRNLTVCPICRTPSASPAAALPSAAPAPPATVAHPASAGQPTDAVRAAEPTVDRRGQPTVYRIPCPRGHVLKAGENMIGQQVVCPKCNEFFVLKISDSLEYQKEMRRLQHEKEAREAARWLRRAIVATVFVVASFAAMIAIKILMK